MASRKHKIMHKEDNSDNLGCHNRHNRHNLWVYLIVIVKYGTSTIKYREKVVQVVQVVPVAACLRDYVKYQMSHGRYDTART